MEASGYGCDGCHPTFGAENTALATFTDRIIFYGPPGGTAAVTWFIEQNPAEGIGLSDLELPIVVQFNKPYDILVTLSGSEAAFGNQFSGGDGQVTIEGFFLFDTSNPACSTITAGLPPDGADPSCGTPEDVSIYTRSRFLYGGHAPEPSSLLLLATAAIALLEARSRRIA